MASRRPCLRALAVCAAASLQAMPPLYAQDYASKPIRLIIAAAAGGSTDTIGRTVGEGFAEALGQPVVYDNRGGAGGIVAAELTARAAADGYTLLLSTAAGIAVSVSLYRKLPYDPVRDFAPVVQAATQAYVMVVTPGAAASVAELLAHARAAPGKLSYGSTGVGTSSHLAGQFLQTQAGVELLHVPYKSMSAVMVDVASGRATIGFGSPIATAPFTRNGRLKALAVTSARHSPATPELPTLEEAGVHGYALENWYGVLAPARTPPAIVVRLNEIANRTLAQPEVKARWVRDGTATVGGTPAEFAVFIKSEITKWAGLLKSAGIAADR